MNTYSCKLTASSNSTLSPPRGSRLSAVGLTHRIQWANDARSIHSSYVSNACSSAARRSADVERTRQYYVCIASAWRFDRHSKPNRCCVIFSLSQWLHVTFWTHAFLWYSRKLHANFVMRDRRSRRMAHIGFQWMFYVRFDDWQYAIVCGMRDSHKRGKLLTCFHAPNNQQLIIKIYYYCTLSSMRQQTFEGNLFFYERHTYVMKVKNSSTSPQFTGLTSLNIQLLARDAVCALRTLRLKAVPQGRGPLKVLRKCTIVRRATHFVPTGLFIAAWKIWRAQNTERSVI